MACLIIGDSLAVGVGQFRPECETIAKVGITSQTYLATRMPEQGVSADTVVISLGVNDGDTSTTRDNLQALRSRVQARSVIWLLPGLKDEVRGMIRDIAYEYRDRVIDTLPQVGRDHLHPTGAGYQRLAAMTMDRQSDVEVAFAPTDLRVPTGFGQNYPQRAVHYAKPSGIGLATPRERIRRLRMLRAADYSAPLVRRVSADVEYRHRPLQKEYRIVETVHGIAPNRSPACAPHGHKCRSAAK